MELEGLLAALTLEPTGEGTYRAPNADAGHGVVFGGQLMAQAVVAAAAGHETKRIKTVHTVFARGGDPAVPVELAVDPIHTGRTFASSTVTISQGPRVCTRSLVLLSSDEPDVIRHADPAPDVGGPDEWSDTSDRGDWQVRIVGDVDISDPARTGPARLDVWTRFRGAPDDDLLDQALLAFASDGFLIATAMRPHEGVGQAQAHVSLATGVISHTLTFHRPAPASEWLLLSHHSPFAGGGRSYGRADAFTPDGALVASYVQDAMIRPMGG